MSGPNPSIAKVMQVFLSMDTMLGKEFESGLANMKAVVENKDSIMFKSTDLGLLLLRVGSAWRCSFERLGKVTAGKDMLRQIGSTMPSFGLDFMHLLWGSAAAFAEFGCSLLLILGSISVWPPRCSPSPCWWPCACICACLRTRPWQAGAGHECHDLFVGLSGALCFRAREACFEGETLIFFLSCDLKF